jgi:hypothetical protein
MEPDVKQDVASQSARHESELDRGIKNMLNQSGGQAPNHRC